MDLIYFLKGYDAKLAAASNETHFRASVQDQCLHCLHEERLGNSKPLSTQPLGIKAQNRWVSRGAAHMKLHTKISPTKGTYIKLYFQNTLN